jgi:chitodextrinase
MANKKIGLKATRKTLAASSRPQRVVALTFAALFALAGVYTLLFSHAAVTSAHLYLSPASQTVTTGSTVVVSVMIDTGGASVNTAQSVLTYSAANFSLVSITPSAAFASFPNPVESSGSIQFSAGSTTAQTGVQTVATVTLTATGTGTSAISLAAICPAGNFALTCSAAYDSVTSNNDLGTITNGSYTVNPVLPTVPTGLSSTGATTTSVPLAWTASTDTGGPGLAGYHVYRNGALVGSTAATTYTDSGLTAGTSYSYTVKAYDTAGNTSAASSPLSVSTQVLPTVPAALHSTTVNATSVSLAWTASTDTGGPGLAGYHVYRNGALVGSTAATTYTDNGLTAGTSYSYTVAAYDTAGNVSAQSSPAVSVTTQVLPSVPTALSGTGATTTSVSLAWTASTDTGGPGLAGYHIYRNNTLVGSTSGTTYNDSGLTTGTSYSYTVAAYDTAGNVSAQSSPAVSVTTPTVTGDLDGDGHVTGHDLSILLTNYGTNYVPAEFDGFTIVEAHDLSILLSNYGK